MITLPITPPPQVPAASLRHWSKDARASRGESALPGSVSNACRNAHANVTRWGLTWKVPMSHLKTDFDGESVQVPYLSPKDFLGFLLVNAPDLLWGGASDISQATANLESFWSAYKGIDPGHVMFQRGDSPRSPGNTLPFAFHGDEGRGAKKGNTCVISMESVLGLPDTSRATSVMTDASFCKHCELSVEVATLFNTTAGKMEVKNRVSPLPPCGCQVHNLKGHSYLTKYVLCVLPNKFYKETDLLDQFMELFSGIFKDLFENGIVINQKRWYVSIVGLKGDLKWFEKIGKLHRCFNKQIGVNLQCCHECGAGGINMPWEDGNHFPCWSNSLFPSRPWRDTEVPAIAQIPHHDREPERMLKRDLFHVSKVGVIRDFLASSLILMFHLGYFIEPRQRGVSNSRESLLQRAHHHFKWYCKCNHKSPGLHSFTKVFFNAVYQSDYPWVNTKGSDSTIMVGWIRVLVKGFLNDILDEDHREVLESVLLAANSIEGWQSLVYNHGLWLNRHCAAVLYDHFHTFIAEYDKLAFWSLYSFRITTFAKKGKLHQMMHFKYEILEHLQDPSVKWILNPLAFACEANEDVVGRISRLSRRVSPQIPVKRKLQLYLMKSKAVYRRYKTVQKNGIKKK